MPQYSPINEESKPGWIEFLENVVKDLDGKPEGKKSTDVTAHENGDVAAMKDLCGSLLATLKNESVTIN
jgi:hypothetical protein